MPGLTLSGIVFILLTQAAFYHRLSLSSEKIDEITGENKNISTLIFFPLLFTLINIFLLDLSSTIEYLTVGLFLWLNAIYFFFLLAKKMVVPLAFLLATVLSELLILITYTANQESLNNLLLILAYTAAVSLILKHFTLKNSIVIAAFVLMAMFDVIFVWLIPAIPNLEAAVQPLLFSPVLKIFGLTLGSGDIIFLLLAIFTLTKKLPYPTTFLTILSLSLSALIAVVITETSFVPTGSFPFLIVLTPIFLLLYFLLPTFKNPL